MDNYSNLGVDRGTVIHATRDSKPLNFKDILQQHKVQQPDRFVQPNPCMGGWGKFIKTEITGHASNGRRTNEYNHKKEQNTIQKNSNRSGWLHRS